MKKNKKQLLNRIALGLVLSTSVCGTVFAVPAATELPNVNNKNAIGTNDIATDNNTHIMTITQDKAVSNAQIDWNTFNIGSAATVNIKQFNTGNTLVNRVVTNSMSEIYGKMNATGNVVLVNPNGILLAKGSEINVGGFAAYASNGTKLTDPANRTSEGNIIANGTINAGVGVAKDLAKAWNINNLAVGLGSASAFGNSNKIALVANGNVTVGNDAKMRAMDTTTLSGSTTEGEESFDMGGIPSAAKGSIYLRPDANDNDYGQVYITDANGVVTNVGNKQFQSKNVSIYYNADVAGTATINGIEYNKKDYKSEQKWKNIINSNKFDSTDAELNTDAGTVTYKTTKDDTAEDKTISGYMLVHNVAQLQDIDTDIKGTTNTDGNMTGKYALGRDLYTKDDTLGNDYSTVLKHNGTNENPIIFTTTDGANGTAISATDSGVFTSATSKKLLDSSNTTSARQYGTKLDYVNATTISATTKNNTNYTYIAGTNPLIKDASGNSYTVAEDGTVTMKTPLGATSTVTDPTIINNVTELKTAAPIALNEFADQTDLGNYVGKDVSTKFKHMDSSTWNGGTGFDPIGTATNTFKGVIFGIGGDVIHIGDGLSEVHTIYDLTINRPNDDNIGLVGVSEGGTIDFVQEKNTAITGKNNVGGLMGLATKGSTVSDSNNYGAGIKGTTDVTEDSGYVRTMNGTDKINNIGGLVGDLEDSTITSSSNSSTVIGQAGDITDGNIKNVGGLTGKSVNSKIYNSTNGGNVFGEENTAGIAGYAEGTTIGVLSSDDPIATVYNQGQVTGTKDTGGIVGYGKNVHLYGVYNTNEDSPLSGNSIYQVTTDGKTIVGQNPPFQEHVGNHYDVNGNLIGLTTTLAGTDITSDAALSKYGQITGKTNTGGLVGEMEATSTIDTAYNAGNVTGVTSTGGLVGKMDTTTDATYTTNIHNAYNGDNNTVVREQMGTVPTAVSQHSTAAQAVIYDGNSYQYNAADAAYYSFYAYDVNGNKVMYYFLPAGGKTEAGASGIFVDASGTVIPEASLPDSSKRIYLNRVGYKDANINGTTNTGGIVGEMNNGIVDTTYDTGTINKGTETSTSGALIGVKDKGTLSNSFFANDADPETGKKYAGQSKAIGTGTSETSVEGYTLVHWRNSDNIKALTAEAFVGDTAKVDKKTGFQEFTDANGVTHYWSTKSDVYHYESGNIVVDLKYDKVNETYYDPNTPANRYTVAGTAVPINEESDTGSKEYVYQTVSFAGATPLKLTWVIRASNETGTTDVTTKNPYGTKANTWLEYQDETTPLLQQFMYANNITRNFTYDAKTHNLKTDDVNNVYGRADFTDGVSGKNVNVAGQAQSADPAHQGESEYFYDSTAVWSPQHGYKLNANVSITITNHDLSVVVEGERTYGDAGNTTGYYVMVPYQLESIDTNTGKTKRDDNGNVVYDKLTYAYYKVTNDTTTPYVLMSDADWTYTDANGVTTTFEKTPEGFMKLADAKGSYRVTFGKVDAGAADGKKITGGVASLEAETELNKSVQHVIEALRVDPTTGTITPGTSGTSLSQIITMNDTTNYPYGDQSLEANTDGYGIYGITYKDDGTIKNATGAGAANVGGLSNSDKNYNIDYSGQLKVAKANLYYTYDGKKVYGDANGSGTNVYTLVNTDADSVNGDSVNGYLKSFDAGKIALGTGADLNKILNGTSTSDGLTATQYKMTGTVNASNKNITDPTGTQFITQKDAGTYYHVMVDANGNVLPYNISTLDNGTTAVATTNTGTDVTYINKNYNMVWKDTAPVNAATTKSVGGITTTKTTAVTANQSTETITPAELKVTVAGKRQYGDLMVQNDYTTDLVLDSDMTKLTEKYYNLTGDATGTAGSGLKAGDTMGTILDDTGVNTIINAIEDQGTTHPATQLNEATDSGKYVLIGNTVQTASNITVEGKTTAQHYNILKGGDYDYTISDGAHAEKIIPREVTITTTATREYGNTPDAVGHINTNTKVTSDSTSHGNGFKSWDQDKFTNNISNWQNTGMYDHSKVTDHVLTDGYGTLGSTAAANTAYKTNGAVVFNGTTKDAIKTAFGNNYNVSYADKLTINKAPLTVTVTGQRQYGDNMNAAGDYTTSSGTIPDITSLTKGMYNVDVAGVKNVNDDTAANVLNTANMKTKLGTVDNGDGNNTDTVGSHTHVGTYTGTSTVKFTLDNANTAPQTTSTNDILTTQANGDYYVESNGTNTLKIVQRQLDLTTTGSKTFDNTSKDPAADTTGAPYDVIGSADAGASGTGTGLKSWDQSKIDDNKVDWINSIVHKNAVANKGTYGTEGAATNTYKTDGYLTYTDAEKTAINKTLSDYAVTYKDLYTINGQKVTIYVKGNRTYGDAPTTTTKTSLTQTGILAGDTAATAAWNANKDTWMGQYVDGTTTATHAGTYGTEGSNTRADYSTGALTLTKEQKDSLQNTLSNYDFVYTDKLTVKQAPLNIEVTGKRQYGDKMDPTTYTTTSGTTPTLTEKIYNVDVQGIKNVNNDSITTVVDEAGMKGKLAEMDAGDGNNTDTIGRLTNAGTYTDGTTVPFGMNAKTKSVISTTTLLPETNAVLTTAGNGDYYVANVNTVNQLEILKRNVTADQTATKLYGTGAEHTNYGGLTYTNVLDEDKAAFVGAEKITNNSNRTTPVDTYTNNLMTIDFASNPTIAQNYNVDTTATLNVIPDTFTYTSDHTSYWQYQHIPAQTGKVTNSFGEDVSDLTGSVTWPTPADGKVVGIFPVWGRGSNDNSGNYHAIQAAGNPTALEVKQVPKNEQTDSALNENLEGAWQSFRRPLLDIMYLTIKDNGFKSWDNGVFVTANPYVPAGDKTNYGIITFNGQVLK